MHHRQVYNAKPSVLFNAYIYIPNSVVIIKTENKYWMIIWLNAFMNEHIVINIQPLN